jgi:hypothetical protein
MSQFSLNPDMNFEVTARFIAKGSDAPVTGDAYSVRLYDKDLLSSDFLGESGLDANGYSVISFNHKVFGDIANLETFPDLYFVVYKNGEPVFKSKVMEDVDLEAIEQYKKGEGEVIDLGTYLIDA